MHAVKLEIAVFTIEAAIAAIKAGADRIEFCENAHEGGTTASHGSLTVLASRKEGTIFPIIRPRGGDFLYSSIEFEVIKSDLLLVKSLGYPGAVIGLLNKDGSIDIERTKELVALAAPMEITFHRAFDRCVDPFEGLEAIIQTGCKRILTSGQVPHVADALGCIQALVKLANGRIVILPGSGVRAKNIKEIVLATGVQEIHSSARMSIPSKMAYHQVSMNESMESIGVDLGEIKEMKTLLAELAD